MKWHVCSAGLGDGMSGSGSRVEPSSLFLLGVPWEAQAKPAHQPTSFSSYFKTSAPMVQLLLIKGGTFQKKLENPFWSFCCSFLSTQ